MANKERILKAIDDLEAQGNYGFFEDRCSYHTIEGNRCIVGLVMHDPRPTDALLPTVASLINVTEQGIKEVLALPDYHDLKLKLRDFNAAELELLAMLQFIHDECALEGLKLEFCAGKLRKEVEIHYA